MSLEVTYSIPRVEIELAIMQHLAKHYKVSVDRLEQCEWRWQNDNGELMTDSEIPACIIIKDTTISIRWR